jgi:hypothetical protein
LGSRIYRYDGEGEFVDLDAPLLRTPWIRAFLGGHTQWGDYDGDGDPDLLMDALVFRNNSPDDPGRVPEEPDPGEPENPPPQAGDANQDGQFDQQDIVSVLQTAKYLTGQPATFQEGDWNRDGVFDQFDIVAALEADNYLRGPYAAPAN